MFVDESSLTRPNATWARATNGKVAMRVFVTVGSTKFDSLIQGILSEDVLKAFRLKGYTNIIVQCGNSHFDLPTGVDATRSVWTFEKEEVQIDVWKFKPTLEDEYNAADLVVSHAGPS